MSVGGGVNVERHCPVERRNPTYSYERTIRKNETTCGFFATFCELLVCVSGRATEGGRGFIGNIQTRPPPIRRWRFHSTGWMWRIFAFYSPILSECSTCRKLGSVTTPSAARDAVRTSQLLLGRCRTPGLWRRVRSAVSAARICRRKFSEVSSRTS